MPDNLRTVFDQLIADDRSTYSKIAAMHAIFSSLGAEFRNINQNRHGTDPYEEVLERRGIVQFNYLQRRPGFFGFIGIPRGSWIIADLAAPDYRLPNAQVQIRPGTMSFYANYPNIQDGYPKIDKNRRDTDCPPVPSMDQALRFASTQR